MLCKRCNRNSSFRDTDKKGYGQCVYCDHLQLLASEEERALKLYNSVKDKVKTNGKYCSDDCNCRGEYEPTCFVFQLHLDTIESTKEVKHLRLNECLEIFGGGE